MILIETQRLLFREMTQADYGDLCNILQDEAVMYAYEGAFTEKEVQSWLDKQLTRYCEDGFGLYVVEAAKAWKKYAFDELNADEVFSIIRDSNIASQNVAKRNGMIQTDTLVKYYRGVEMPHYVFSVKRSDCDAEL